MSDRDSFHDMNETTQNHVVVGRRGVYGCGQEAGARNSTPTIAAGFATDAELKGGRNTESQMVVRGNLNSEGAKRTAQHATTLTRCSMDSESPRQGRSSAVLPWAPMWAAPAMHRMLVVWRTLNSQRICRTHPAPQCSRRGKGTTCQYRQAKDVTLDGRILAGSDAFSVADMCMYEDLDAGEPAFPVQRHGELFKPSKSTEESRGTRTWQPCGRS